MTDQWLDRMARDAEPYLQDGGFTEALMARLPAPREVAPRIQLSILGVAALAASGVVAQAFPMRPVLDFLVNSAQVPVIAATTTAIILTTTAAFELTRRIEL